MTTEKYIRVRAAVLGGGDPPAELIADCLRTAKLMIRTAGLPAHYSPLGVWSDEAIEEVFASFTADRLIARGQLLAMLQRAPALPVFRRMVEIALRQHLIDGLRRSQSTNLYRRITHLLEDGGRYSAIGTGSGRLWQLAEGAVTPFSGDDRALAAVAWSLGDFNIIRYRPDALKLSPLLDSEELARFIDGLLAQNAMSAATISRALNLRFALEDPAASQPVDPNRHAAAGLGADPQHLAIHREIATATLAELTTRQIEVLVGIERKENTRELAVRLHCSTGTISHERARIAAVLARIGADAPEVLKEILDALLIGEE